MCIGLQRVWRTEKKDRGKEHPLEFKQGVRAEIEKLAGHCVCRADQHGDQHQPNDMSANLSIEQINLGSKGIQVFHVGEFIYVWPAVIMVSIQFNNSPMTTRFCIVRHGETAWNAEMRVQGQLDIPLNAVGRWQAQQVAGALTGIHFDAVVSSDLLRAFETAQLATSNYDGEISRNIDLRERHYGKFQGLKYVEAQQQFPEDFAAHSNRHLEFAYGNGESLNAFAIRVSDVMSALARKYSGKTTLVVTHGGVLDVLYRLASGLYLQAPRNFPIPNAAINWLEYDDQQWSITDWANGAHLEQARDELAP